jgi:hypothetical protein
MTYSLPATCLYVCQAEAECDSPPSFQARLDGARDEQQPRVHVETDSCARHLGEMVVAMTKWANDHHLTSGDLTVLAIDPPNERNNLLTGPRQNWPQNKGFVFTTMRLGN